MSTGTEPFTEQPTSGYSPMKGDSSSLSTHQWLIVLSYRCGFGLTFGCDLRKMNLLPFLNLMPIVPIVLLKKNCIKLFFYATVDKGVHLDSRLSNFFSYSTSNISRHFSLLNSCFLSLPSTSLCMYVCACICVHVRACVYVFVGLTVGAWG